jgi:hypothetical protein
MNGKLIAGIVLIAVGICGLAYEKIGYTTREKVIDAGPIQVSADKEHAVSVPPILGAIALAGGIALIFMSRKGNA